MTTLLWPHRNKSIHERVDAQNVHGEEFISRYVASGLHYGQTQSMVYVLHGGHEGHTSPSSY